MYVILIRESVDELLSADCVCFTWLLVNQGT